MNFIIITQNKLKNLLVQLPRNLKRLLLISIDIITLCFAVWLALMIRQESFFWPEVGYALTGATSTQVYIMILLAPVVTIPLLIFTRLYRSITRYITIETYVKITKACFVSAVLWSIIIYYIQLPIPRSVFIIYLILSTVFVYFTRFTARDYLLSRSYRKTQNVLIYGTGDASRQIVDILRTDLEINPVGFISDGDEYKKISIAELPVYNKNNLKNIIIKKDIEEILITITDQSRKGLRKIVNDLRDYQKIIRKLPNIRELASGKIKVSDIERINIEDLLGRDAVKPDPYLLKACIENKTILITGCGGSIGSELARQIIHLNPKKIILMEQSEYFLYEVDQELSNYKIQNKCQIPIQSYLGSVADKGFIAAIFSKESIDTVYHAAANKHVPLVEHNPLAAIETNIFGTFIVASEAYKNNVENFVLISSDKAVRPTNIMGATKRFAELILQSLQDVVDNLPSKKCSTKFCMVRFGNVLDTSGSVVPLFRKQIEEGGPVTVTDSKVIRYFMTISEATELVIQAGSLSKGGDVFLLEMGEPINILDLAKEMVRLSGNEIKDENNPIGDIEITFTGLRTGEKLYEELLIGENVSKTIHTHIMSANEEKLGYDRILFFLDKFKSLNPQSPIKDIQNILYDSVSGYTPYKDSNVIDIKK